MSRSTSSRALTQHPATMDGKLWSSYVRLGSDMEIQIKADEQLRMELTELQRAGKPLDRATNSEIINTLEVRGLSESPWDLSATIQTVQLRIMGLKCEKTDWEVLNGIMLNCISRGEWKAALEERLQVWEQRGTPATAYTGRLKWISNEQEKLEIKEEFLKKVRDPENVNFALLNEIMKDLNSVKGRIKTSNQAFFYWLTDVFSIKHAMQVAESCPYWFITYLGYMLQEVRIRTVSVDQYAPVEEVFNVILPELHITPISERKLNTPFGSNNVKKTSADTLDQIANHSNQAQNVSSSNPPQQTQENLLPLHPDYNSNHGQPSQWNPNAADFQPRGIPPPALIAAAIPPAVDLQASLAQPSGTSLSALTVAAFPTDGNVLAVPPAVDLQASLTQASRTPLSAIIATGSHTDGNVLAVPPAVNLQASSAPSAPNNSARRSGGWIPTLADVNAVEDYI